MTGSFFDGGGGGKYDRKLQKIEANRNSSGVYGKYLPSNPQLKSQPAPAPQKPAAPVPDGPGYVNVPGKGMRYRNAEGQYFDNHFGSIFNSFGNAVRGIGDAYNPDYATVWLTLLAPKGVTDQSPDRENQPRRRRRKIAGGNVTRVGGKEYDMSDPKQVETLNAVLAADKASRPDQTFC